MSNTISLAHNPYFYAAEAIAIMKKALGMGLRVHRGFDAERRTFGLGDTIRIKKPATLSTQAGGTGTVQDLYTDKVDIVLNNWREVKFGLTDKELAYTGEQIIQEHIGPAAYALADYVDQQLVGLAKSVPWSYNEDSSFGYGDFLACRKILRDVAGNIVDMGDNHFAIDSTLEAAFLGLNLFNDASTGAGTTGLIQGSLGMRAGVQPFVNQNLETYAAHTSGTVVSAGTDNAGALVGAHTRGATTISVDGLSLVETLVAGDSFVIAGNSQRYVVTATTTLTSGANTAVPIFPALVQAYDNDSVVTFEADSSTVHAGSYYGNIMFNRSAFALAFAALPTVGMQGGPTMGVVQDPDTGIALRSRIAYTDSSATPTVTLDVLFGTKVLDPNKAVIYRRNK